MTATCPMSSILPNIDGGGNNTKMPNISKMMGPFTGFPPSMMMGHPSRFFEAMNGSECPAGYGPHSNKQFHPTSALFSEMANRPSSAAEYYSMRDPVRLLDMQGNRELWLSFHLTGFKPEEINVTYCKNDHSISIEGRTEIKDGKEHQLSHHYYRKYVLPEKLAKLDLSKLELKSYLSDEGILTIKAPLPRISAEEFQQCPVMTHPESIMAMMMPTFNPMTAPQPPGWFNGGAAPTTHHCPANFGACPVHPVNVKTT